jgi:methyl-accepting chemotaxis protein
MVGIAVVGLVVAVVGTVVAWRFTGELHTALDDSLAITEDAVITVEESIVLADRVLVDVAAGLGGLDATLFELERSIGDAGPVLDDVAELSGDVPVALIALQDTLGEVAAAAREIDSLLSVVSQLPFAPDVAPERSLADQVGRLSADLDPIVATLEGSAEGLGELAASTDRLRLELGQLSRDVRVITNRLEESARLVGRYREQAAEAGGLAARTRADLAGQVATMRLLIVLGGLVFAASQFVPLWVGADLLASPAPNRRLEPPDEGDDPRHLT